MLGDIFVEGDGENPLATDQIRIADFSNNILRFIDQTIVRFQSLFLNGLAVNKRMLWVR